MVRDVLTKAEEVIRKNRYMVLATSSSDGRPWANVVFYAFDKDFNFYFLSAIDSLHAENIAKDQHIAFVIYDSSQPIGSFLSVQAKGKVSEVGKDRINKVISLYSDRLFPKSELSPLQRYPMNEYLEPSEFRFFRIEPEEIDVSGITERRTKVSMKGEEEEITGVE